MVDAIKAAYTAITATAEAQARFAGGVFPLYAEEGTDRPFITYKVDEVNPEAKGGLGNYNLAVTVFDDDYLNGAQSAQNIKEQLLEAGILKSFYFQGSDSDYSNGLKTAYVTMSFTFKK
jgi:hypothetical protein